MKFLVLLLVLSAAPVAAEPRVQLPTKPERTAASVASWVTVVTLAVLDTKASWDCQARLRCFEWQAARTGAVYVTALTIKQLVHRERPCAPNDCGIDQPNTSFFSAHTAMAFSTRGGPRLAFELPLAITTGGLRVAAGKHWMTDTLAGAGVGLAASFIR